MNWECPKNGAGHALRPRSFGHWECVHCRDWFVYDEFHGDLETEDASGIDDREMAACSLSMLACNEVGSDIPFDRGWRIASSAVSTVRDHSLWEPADRQDLAAEAEALIRSGEMDVSQRRDDERDIIAFIRRVPSRLSTIAAETGISSARVARALQCLRRKWLIRCNGAGKWSLT
jgi:hypothetical protein